MVAGCSHQEVIPLALFIFGMVAGLLLAAWATYVCWMILRYRDRRRQNLLEQAALEALEVAPSTWIVRKTFSQKEQAALEALEVAPVEIDDDHMACAACWENRNPGAIWGLRIRPLCSEHEEPEAKVVNPGTGLEDVHPVLETSWLRIQCSVYVQGLLQTHP